jgi:hypothetical protein
MMKRIYTTQLTTSAAAVFFLGGFKTSNGNKSILHTHALIYLFVLFSVTVVPAFLQLSLIGLILGCFLSLSLVSSVTRTLNSQVFIL